MNFSNLRGIIFDFDGTMVDSEPVWKDVTAEIYLATHGVAPTQEDMWDNTGIGVDKFVVALDRSLDLETTQLQRDSMMNAINDETHRRILEDLPLREGTLEILEYAHERNLKTAICTASTSELIHTFLKNRDMEHHFDHIISTDQAPMDQRKPHPYPYLKSLEALEISAEEALAIEDSPTGVASALAADIRTVAIPHVLTLEVVEGLNPTLLIQNFQQLLDHLYDESI